MTNETYYSILEVSETASAKEIKAAYLRRIREVHPDFIANAPDYWKHQAEEKAKEINEARNILSNPDKRRLYDAQLVALRGSSGSGSGTYAAQTSSSHPTGSPQGQSHSSTTPGSNSGSSYRTAQHAGTNPQQQAPSTSTPPSNQPSRRAPPLGIFPTRAAKRISLVCICVLGLGMAVESWRATSVEEQVIELLEVIGFFCVAAYFCRRRLRPLLAGKGVHGSESQAVVTVGIIACTVLLVRLAGNHYQNGLPHYQSLPAERQSNKNQEAAKSNSTALNADNRGSVDGNFESRFPWYVDTITTTVRNNWYTQDINPQTPYGTQAKVRFTIGHDGVVSNVSLSTPSSSRTLDRTAQQAVERVTRFGKLPSAYTDNAVTLGYTFTYDQTPRLTEDDLSELAGKAGFTGEDEASFTPEQLKSYYAVYSAPDVQYLRLLFAAYLAGSPGHEGEFEILKRWSPDYYRSKFIVLYRGPSLGGGTEIDVIFQQRPDKVFYVWVYPVAGQSGPSPELRSFEPSDSWAKADMSRVRAAYKKLLEDKEHAM